MCFAVMETVTVLTQSADYVKIGTDNAVTVIDSPLDISDIQTETGTDCLVSSSFTWYGLEPLSNH